MHQRIWQAWQMMVPQTYNQRTAVLSVTHDSVGTAILSFGRHVAHIIGKLAGAPMLVRSAALAALFACVGLGAGKRFAAFVRGKRRRGYRDRSAVLAGNTRALLSNVSPNKAIALGMSRKQV